jgi:cell division protein ZapB
MEKKSQKSRQTGMIVLVVALISAIFVLLFLMRHNLSQQKSDYEKLLATQKSDYEQKFSKLESELKEQIKKAERLGEEQSSMVDSLKKVLQSVENDRNNLKRTLQLTLDQNKQYKEKIEAYEMLLRAKDKEIEKLKQTADILYKENNDLKNEKNNITIELTDEKKKRESLQGKVEEASVLKAENIQVNMIDRRGKESSGGQYRASRIDKLSISFNFADNKLAKIGNKDIYMRIVEPTGTVLFNQGSSGDFEINGKKMSYTSRQQILFDNSRQKVTFLYGRSGEYQSGRHIVEFYSEGARIGYGSFEIR